MIQREQLADELNNMKSRFDGYVENTQKIVNQEKDGARKECKIVIDEQNTKVCLNWRISVPLIGL